MIVPRKQRNASIEYLRILAAFGIVWFHTQNISGRSIGYTGLPVFLIIFCSLSVLRLQPESLISYTGRKARRLLIPWLFWSIIYVGYKLFKQSVQHTEFSDNFTYIMFITGPCIHLWYLPFAFIMAIVINVLQRFMVDMSALVTILIMTVSGVAFLSLSSIALSTMALPIPLPQWIFGIPAVPLGFAVGKVNASTSGRLQKFLYFGFAITICVVSLVLYYLGYRIVIKQYSLGLVLVCIAFMWNFKWNPLLHRFASLTLGIYLIHPLVDSALKYVIKPTLNPWLVLILVFLISSVAIMVLQKTPLKKFV